MCLDLRAHFCEPVRFDIRSLIRDAAGLSCLSCHSAQAGCVGAVHVRMRGEIFAL